MQALTLTTATAEGLTMTDVERIGAALDASIAPNTAKAYRAALDRFAGWLAGREATDATIAAYVAALMAEGKAGATIKLAAAAIGAGARAQGRPDPRGPLTRQAIKGAVRANRGRGRGQAKGLRREDAIATAALAAADGTPKGLRDAALIRVMSDALLRASEAAAATWADLQAADDGSGRLTIRHSKTDQDGEGAVCYLTEHTMTVLAAWRECVAAAEPAGVNAAGAIFRPCTRGGNVVAYATPAGLALTVPTVRNVIRDRAAAAGFNGCTAHSLRVGSAQSLIERGASTAAVANVGRWSDPGMVVRYSRNESAGRSAVARLFGGK